MNYKIVRPPLAADFELPVREDLLQLKPGDLVKVRIQVKNDTPERMWVELVQCNDPDTWSGRVDNDATQQDTLKVIPADTLVSFHPLDIIDVW